MNIREAKSVDLETVLILFADTIKETCADDYNKEQIEAWTASIRDKVKWLNRIKEHYFLVAEINDRTAGFASLENYNHIDLMYVHPDYQGKGVARSLLQRLLMKAQGNSVTAHVSITAQPFFASNGFKVVKENRFELRNVEIANFEMQLVLD
ncbi:MAG: GNAT family N-acetyltransferase [Bacteroidota bacterium]